ncbi:concanavalin A-like lectin/glucanase domain-containing protein [Cercophora scortea]|uniref:Crh-like protein n=1 Tax=Cercophora scortea TaxID=314031 RepID=A0AAE0MII2_9PEZI|nr:concanavalin A-like lectin/glucanase domain-containing protein [Cercophora scortea]
MFSKLVTATTVALAATMVSAQTFTSCDPTKKTCPNEKALGKEIINIDFRKGDKADDFFTVLEGTKLSYDSSLGAVYTISKETDAPTVASNKYIFFGQVDVTVRAAPGKGIVTSFVLQSADLDEIDWEWIGSDSTEVQTNFFSKGCTEVYDRGGFSPVANPQNEFHTYTIKWTPTTLQWIIDGTVVRTLSAATAKGCSGFPQTPMQVKLGTWVAGRKDAPQGTIDWAGGLANFAEGPFIGYYQSIKIQDYMGGDGVTGPSDATEYAYTDRSGTWQSIKVIGGDGSSSGSKDSSSSSTPASTKSTTSSPSSTLVTVTSSATSSTGSSSSSGSSSSFSPSTSSTPSNGTLTDSGLTGTQTRAATTNQTGAPSSGAGRLAFTLGNIAAMGAAMFLGTLLL